MQREFVSIDAMPSAPIDEALASARPIIDLVQQPLAVLDRERCVRHANAAFQQLTPLELPPLDAAFEGHVQIQIQHGHRQLLVEARPFDDCDAILVAIEDVTERREIERALQHHECLLDAITDAVFSLDTSWRILTWNPAAERFLGFTAADAIGKRSEEVVLIDSAVDREQIREKLAAGQVIDSEGLIRHKDGEWIEMRASTVPVRDRAGKAIGFVCIMHDIRETKRLERELRDNVRTVEDANRELDSFTYSVSHDLRAPLRAIDGFSRILVEDHGERMTKEESRLVGVIRKNTQQMGQLIDDLLAFVRLGRKELAKTHVDMKGLLIELVPQLLAGTEHRMIDLRAGALPPVVGDRALLKQVWLNLMANAIKYTRNRERAVIQISGETREGELVYKVEDNGAGFSMQYIDKLFGVFQRLHRETEFEGTGVGLALVQRIVRRHGGRVWAEGEEDRGATFWFALPRLEGEGHGHG